MSDEDHHAPVGMAKRNGDVVRRVIDEIWNQGNLAVADNLFTPSYANHGGLVPDMVRGPEGIKLAAALHRAAFPDLRLTVECLIAEEEIVAVRWRARGSPSARPDSAPLGESADTLVGMTFCRLEGRKIAESWTTWDSQPVLRQLTEMIGRAPSGRPTAANGLD